jgi:hypothetical protein
MTQNTPNSAPFVIFGTDMTDATNWSDFAEMYVAYTQIGGEDDKYPSDEIEDQFGDFPAEDPYAAVACLEALSTYTHPKVRSLAGRVALVDLMNNEPAMEPARTAAVVARVLRASEEWPSFMHDMVKDEFILAGAPDIGVRLVAQVVTAYNESKAKLKPVPEGGPAD